MFEEFELFEEFPKPKFQNPKSKTQILKLFKPETLQPSEASSAKLNPKPF